jgi:chromosome segregation ATPase
LPIIAIQVTPSLLKDGLPYWILWFMLLIIVLLVLFIFLRDKRLRLRLSSFLAGAKKRSVLLQLRFRLKRERQKKGHILRLLGEKAWGADIRLQGTENIHASLGALVKRRDADQMEAKNALAEIEHLHKRMEETQAQFGEKVGALRSEKQPFDEQFKRLKEEKKAVRKQAGKPDEEGRDEALEKKIKRVVQTIDQFEDSIKELEAEAKDQHHEIAREIHHWEKTRKKALGRIKEIEGHQEELYVSFGRFLETKKVNNADLQGLYAEVDGVNKRIATLKHRIEFLSGG